MTVSYTHLDVYKRQAQDTLDVNLRSTSGSAKCFPSPVANFPIPKNK